MLAREQDPAGHRSAQEVEVGVGRSRRHVGVARRRRTGRPPSRSPRPRRLGAGPTQDGREPVGHPPDRRARRCRRDLPVAEWKTWQARTGPAPKASRSKTHVAGSAGSGGKSTRCDHPASRQKGRSNPSTTFSYRPKPSRETTRDRSRGRGGVKSSSPPLRTPSGTATTTCEPASVCPRSDETAHALVRQLDPRRRPVEADVEPGRHGVHDRRVPVPRQVAEVGLVVLVLRPEPLQRLLLGRAGRVRLDVRPEALPGPSQRIAREAGRGQVRLDAVGRGGGRSQLVAQPAEGGGEAPGIARRARLELRRVTATGRSARSNPARSGSGSPGRHSTPASRAKRRSGLPEGWCSQEPPRSTGEPCRSTVCSRPPTRLRASSTTHSTPAWWSAFATVSPAMPAPTTRTRRTGPAVPSGMSRLPSS